MSTLGFGNDYDPVDLVIEPELRRYGNSKGDDLMSESLVSEPCKKYQIPRP